MKMNTTKFEFTHVERRKCRQEEYWRKTKKLGSLLGDPEDVSCRKNLARIALSRMWTLWVNKNCLGENVFVSTMHVKPVLTYNSGTWGITNTKIKGLESFSSVIL